MHAAKNVLIKLLNFHKKVLVAKVSQSNFSSRIVEQPGSRNASVGSLAAPLWTSRIVKEVLGLFQRTSAGLGQVNVKDKETDGSQKGVEQKSSTLAYVWNFDVILNLNEAVWYYLPRRLTTLRNVMLTTRLLIQLVDVVNPVHFDLAHSG